MMEYYDWLTDMVRDEEMVNVNTAHDSQSSGAETNENTIERPSFWLFQTLSCDSVQPPDSPMSDLEDDFSIETPDERCANDAAIAEACNSASRQELIQQRQKDEERVLQMFEDEAIARVLAESDSKEGRASHKTKQTKSLKGSKTSSTSSLTRADSLLILERQGSLVLDRSILRRIRRAAARLKLFPKVSKHTPRVNSAFPLLEPVVSEARARLLLRLELYGLSELVVDGDGSCQFRSLSDQMFRNPHYHAHVRECVVEQLKKESARYMDYVPENYEAYLERMAKASEWGDHVTLQAAADFFGTEISILTSFEEEPLIVIKAEGEIVSERVLWLSFWAEVHYNSVYPESDLPNLEDRICPSKSLNI
mmetsp:Transcript_23567/g.32477  ORF Transcript_23567/g.32477 Transcript_23567/m.32477 type:complete len:366 (+) Transcript_23567:120-1217(+)|eukprot:CAMPEP_0196584130 /NCGR_PEP_ID=MMETSP1081-20130531/45867_1 /TAXON_ID=36882 /ORGANISM="Pyramimonas amylifera, Strain CCMP720" /LENGTH=365 /DNA_ID=CAMNT_0041905233 /DNA_START=60 /DNA_END=1157 /DNA_ORIENTATION=-